MTSDIKHPDKTFGFGASLTFQRNVRVLKEDVIMTNLKQTRNYASHIKFIRCF